MSRLQVHQEKELTQTFSSLDLLEDIIQRLNPGTVLDLWNKGAVSLLGARMGCSVISVDSDEVSMDNLYLQACKENLPITPLVIQPARFFESRKYSGGKQNLHLTPTERLGCELVVLNSATANDLIHENILSPEDLAMVFDRLASRHLVFLNHDGAKLHQDLMTWMEAELIRFFPVIKRVTSENPDKSMILCSKGIKK